jgi:hypothetical protein
VTAAARGARDGGGARARAGGAEAGTEGAVRGARDGGGTGSPGRLRRRDAGTAVSRGRIAEAGRGWQMGQRGAVP